MDIENYAAMLEAQQADRDVHEVWVEIMNDPYAHTNYTLEYRFVSALHYLMAAEKAAML